MAVKKGKLLLQVQVDMLHESFPNAEDFEKAFTEEMDIFLRCLSQVLVRKAVQRDKSSMTYLIKSEEGSFVTTLSWPLCDIGYELFNKFELVTDRIYIYNYGHGLMLNFCDKEDKVFKSYTIEQIGCKTFSTLEKAGIKIL